MNTQDLTGLQKMQVAYAHFTLEEWKLLLRCVYNTQGELAGTRRALDDAAVHDMLSKFPSAVL